MEGGSATPLPNYAEFLTADYWHHPVQTAGGPLFKEWSHFCVMQDDFDLLVNFSHLGTRSGVETRPRLTVLLSYANGLWDGDMLEFAPEDCTLVPGRFDAAFGKNRMLLDETGYHLNCHLQQRDITIALDLTPSVSPVVANTVRLSDREAIRWMVVPHLRAAGLVTLQGTPQEIGNAPAYHDRNWGCFSWGGSYAWEWATLVPAEESVDWCLVYSRISDQSRGVTRSQSLILWKGRKPNRKFFGRDITVETHGHLRQDRTLQIPRMMALVLNPSAPDVPQAMTIQAHGFGADLRAEIAFEGFGHIGVPNDRGLGLTTLCEIAGRCRISGQVAGEDIDFAGRVQMEINCAEP